MFWNDVDIARDPFMRPGLGDEIANRFMQLERIESAKPVISRHI